MRWLDRERAIAFNKATVSAMMLWMIANGDNRSGWEDRRSVAGCQYVKWKWKRLYRVDAWSLLQWHFNSSDWDDSGLRPQRSSARPIEQNPTALNWTWAALIETITKPTGSNQSLHIRSFSLSLWRCDGWNWLIVVFLLSDWYKCRLAAIAELQVSTKGNNSFNYCTMTATRGKQGISQATKYY